MSSATGTERIKPAWWTLILVVTVSVLVFVSYSLFAGTFRSFVPVTLESDRAGLVMESGGKVKMHGLVVGRVATVRGGQQPVRLKLELFPDQVRHIPSNVQAEIKATTAFGAKYVDLIYPENPSGKSISAGAVLFSRNVSTEVNTVFENLVGVLDQVDPAKLNAILSAIAEGLRGKGERIGEATSDANQILLALNPRMDTIGQDFRSLKGFSDAYGGAAEDILRTLNAATTTGSTIVNQAGDLDRVLLGTVGFGQAGIDLLGPSKDNLINAVNTLKPTTDLLFKYNPEYTCLLMGANWFLTEGGKDVQGGNGYSLITDTAILLGDDPYRYPDNLPIVAAKGGPGGKPGCGSLPDPTKNFPVRQLITNTGWGTGLDIRPNPGLAHPWWANFFPVTRGMPEQPSIRGQGPPAIGPVPYPGAPPYGAPMYGPGGQPLWPGLPPAPPAGPQLAPPPNSQGQQP